MKTLFRLAMAGLLLASTAAFAQDAAPGTTKKDSYRFVIIPKVVHPWFDKVNDGAKAAAQAIEAQTGAKV